jgi:hypothetical protein
MHKYDIDAKKSISKFLRMIKEFKHYFFKKNIKAETFFSCLKKIISKAE